MDGINNMVDEIQEYDAQKESKKNIRLARKALTALEERKNEDIDKWAKKLAKDVSRLND